MEAKDTGKNTPENVDTYADIEGYPPDPDPEYDSMDLPAPEPSSPIPRGAAVRAKVLQVRPPQSKRAKRVAKRSTRIISRQKQRQAIELRKAGASYDQIAEAVGYKDKSGARKAVIRAYDEIVQEPVAELKTIQVERLNHMLMTLWPKVQQGDENAIRTTLQVMDKIDRLMGTEAATQMDVNINQQNAVLVIDGNKEDYIRNLRQMAGAGVQPDGTNAPALNAGSTPPGMSDNEDIVDAEIVNEVPGIVFPGRPQVQTVDPEPETLDLHSADAPGQKRAKQWNFGVDPTVQR